MSRLSSIPLKSPFRKRSVGSISVLTAVLATLVLLPVGLFAFEVGRVNLGQKELKASTDAAALAGAIAMNKQPSSMTEPEKLAAARAAALMYLQRNTVCGRSLGNAEISESVDTDVPQTAHTNFDLLYDQTTSVVTAKAVTGMQPSFGKFLHLPDLPVHGTSKATFGDSEPNDIAVIFDNSGSMSGVIDEASDYAAAFISRFSPAAVHMTLITFNNHATVVFPLSKTLDHVHDSQQYMDRLHDTSNGTRSIEAFDRALEQLNGPEHRPEAKKVIVFITDGLANRTRGNGGSYDKPLARLQVIEAATRAGYENITVHGVGFFHKDYDIGVPFMQDIKTAAGGTSETYMARDLPELKKALESLKIGGTGAVALVN